MNVSGAVRAHSSLAGRYHIDGESSDAVGREHDIAAGFQSPKYKEFLNIIIKKISFNLTKKGKHLNFDRNCFQFRA